MIMEQLTGLKAILAEHAKSWEAEKPILALIFEMETL
jgi:hypothetical protein